VATMRALVKTAPDKAGILAVPVPVPGPRDVLIKVRAAALCGTDLHIFAWNAWARGAGIALPLVMGHECCGDVVAVGRDVTGVNPGDKVAAETHIPCDQCYQCQNGEQHICANLRLLGIHTPGCFAEYAVIPAICARPIPAAIPYDTGAVMEPLGTALRAVAEASVAGATVCVLGCGPIGLFAVAAAAALGAAAVFAADISPGRLAIAAQLGARPLDARGDIAAAVLAATGGIGVDAVIEASGSADAVKASFRCLRKGGRMALVGLPDRPVDLDLGRDIVFKEAKLVGIHGRTIFATWTRMENLLAAGKLAVAPVITHTLPLESWRQGVELTTGGRACKVIFRPELSPV
jgi:threonine 3-dehydrogenase